MSLLTPILHLLGSGATAYITARNLRDRKTCPDLLAGFQLAESGSVPFLQALSQRAETEGDLWLAEKLARHAQDEQRHGQIFAHALKLRHKQVIDFQALSAKPATEKPDERRQRSPFFAAYYQGYEQADLKPDRIDWLVFLASTHILERDACKDFVRMANALSDDPVSLNLKKGLYSIAKDEEGHAAYLQEALERRLFYPEAVALIDEWRTRKVNALVAMVSNLVQKGGKFPSMARDGVPSELDGSSEPSNQIPNETAAL